jgi:hypothetical protein
VNTPATPPRQVLLFSGHMVDAPDRATPRFPPAMVPAAAAAIGGALDTLGAGPADLALTQGAAGGDLLFVQACVERGMPVQLLLPLPEAEFIQRSILSVSDGAAWQQRFLALRPRLGREPALLPAEAGTAGGTVFERCNEWLLATALAHGAGRLRFICLWDGGGGDGTGGTAHMVKEVTLLAGEVTWIRTQDL